MAQEKTPAQTHIEAALVHYKDLEYEKALDELDRAQRRSRTQEDTASVLLYEGIVLAEMGREEEAAASFEAALRLRPDAVLPLAVSPKIKQRFETTRESLKAQAHTEQGPAEPEAQVEPPVLLADGSKPAVPRDAPQQRQAEPGAASLNPQGEVIPYEPAAEEGPSFSGSRLTLELLGGAGGAVVGGGLGLLLGLLASPLVCPENDGGDCLLTTSILIGLPVGAAGGLSFGTYGVGKIMGGRGGYGFTLLGTVVGTALGAGITLLTSSEVGVLGIGVGALGGAVVGYELSHSWSGPLPGALPRTNAALSVLPVLGVTPQGRFLAGLTGRF